MRKALLFLLAFLFVAPAYAQFADQRQYAPSSGGSANAQTVSIPNYNYNVGVVIRFLPAYTNSGAMTLAVNGGTAYNVLMSSTAGLVSLPANQVVSGQIAEVVYDGTQFELLHSSIPYYSGFTVNSNGSIVSKQVRSPAQLPSLTSCGTGSPVATAGSSNNNGQFTFGGGSPTACTVNFLLNFPIYAYCTVTPASDPGAGLRYWISASSNAAFTVSLSAGTSNIVFNYTCFGN